MSKTIIPPYLKKGDIIGITCPSGHMNPKNAEVCIKLLQEKGYQVFQGQTVTYPSDNYFSAPDEIKIAELQAMLDAPEIKAILFGRGGYGMSRIIDQLDFKSFKKNPKWLIGFSDITVILNHVYANYGIAAIHGPMCSSFKNKKHADNVTSLLQCISGRKVNISAATNTHNRPGKASGKLIGGNLSLLANIVGTTSDIETKDHILLIEDLGEYLYAVDRMMQQLKRSGKLSQLSALIVGEFTDMKDTERPFGKKLEQIILDAVKEYDYPVCFDFPVSHGNKNTAVKIGVDYQLNISKSSVTLKEKAS